MSANRKHTRGWSPGRESFSEAAPKVDFLVCGVKKAGTSALDQYLRLHEDITMANWKEVHYFDRDENFGRGRSSQVSRGISGKMERYVDGGEYAELHLLE